MLRLGPVVQVCRIGSCMGVALRCASEASGKLGKKTFKAIVGKASEACES